MGYLDVNGFKVRTVMPPSNVDELEAKRPGWLLTRLDDESAWIDSRLRKRYASPFLVPYPIQVLRWLCAIVTVDAYKALGWNPSSQEDQDIVEDAKRAREEIKEAADSNEGLFDLPLRSDTTSTGISRGGPYAYSEPSPYAWTDVQAQRVANGE